jgi:hypothetical protein
MEFSKELQEQSEHLDKKMGREVIDYLSQYKGNPIYADIAQAIQFGYDLNERYK